MTVIADINLSSTVQKGQAMNPDFSCQKRFKVRIFKKARAIHRGTQKRTSHFFFTYCHHRVFCIDWKTADLFPQFTTFLVKTFKLIFKFPLYCCKECLNVSKKEAKKFWGTKTFRQVERYIFSHRISDFASYSSVPFCPRSKYEYLAIPCMSSCKQIF